jgi:formylglycine-generating enzyme required for sulfatase activity
MKPKRTRTSFGLQVLSLLIFLQLFLISSKSEFSALTLQVNGRNEIQFVPIPSGDFLMGCDEDKGKIDGNECFIPDIHGPRGISSPTHHVTITKDFQLGKYEVTQEQWAAVMGTNPSHFQYSKNLPVENVTPKEIARFIESLNSRHDGYHYRLPTEAEWEYAARAGIYPTPVETGSFRRLGRDASGERLAELFEDPQHFPPLTGTLDGKAWYSNNSDGKTHPVGEKAPNAWGLYDMLGNVAELVQDYYYDKYYKISPDLDPTGFYNSSFGFLARGGSWNLGSQDSNVWSREPIAPFEERVRFARLGFRCVRERKVDSDSGNVK